MFEEMPEQQAPININEQIKCVMRELGYRRTVYPRLVASGKMTGAASAKEICRMEAVLESLKDYVALLIEHGKRDEPD